MSSTELEVPKSVLYEALPFAPTLERASVGSKILRSLCKYETLFTDYERACPALCMECPACERRREAVVRTLLDPYARVWEVWRFGADADIVGILYLTRVVPGCDAYAHYVFFDGDLRGKSHLIEEMIQWAFTDHADEGWIALKRLTVEVPDYAFALARHATKVLGFGGAFTHRVGRHSIPVEGVRRAALRWRDQDRDILILGRLNDGSI